MPLQRENRNVRGNDDQHRKQRRPSDFNSRIKNPAEASFFILMAVRFCQFAEHVLDHDHRTVDNDAKVHRAEGQQVGWNADQRQADKGRKQ